MSWLIYLAFPISALFLSPFFQVYAISMAISTVKQQIRSGAIQCYIAYRWSRSPFSELNLRSQCTIVHRASRYQFPIAPYETTVSTVGRIWIPDIKPVPRLPYKVVRCQTLCLSCLVHQILVGTRIKVFKGRRHRIRVQPRGSPQGVKSILQAGSPALQN